MTAKPIIFDPPQNDVLKLLSLLCLLIPFFLAIVANAKGTRWTLKSARMVLRYAKAGLWIKLFVSCAFLIPGVFGFIETIATWKLRMPLLGGISFAFFASYLFLKTLAPSVLVLSASGPHIKIHFAELKEAIFPVRPVGLLRSLAESKARGWMDVRKWIEWRISDDMFRQNTEQWLEVVEQLAQLVPLIIFDVRIINEPVLKEIELLKRLSSLHKTIFIVDDLKQMPSCEATGLSPGDDPILVLPEEVTAIAKCRFRLQFPLLRRSRRQLLSELVRLVREEEDLIGPDEFEIEKYRLLEGLADPEKAIHVQIHISSLLPKERNQLLLRGLRYHPTAEVRAKCFSLLNSQNLTEDDRRQVIDASENNWSVGAQTLRRIVQVETWLNFVLFIALPLIGPSWNRGISWVECSVIAIIGLCLTQREAMRAFEIRYPPKFKRTFLHGLRLGMVRGVAIGTVAGWHGIFNDVGSWNSVIVNSLIFGLGGAFAYPLFDRLLAGPVPPDLQKRRRQKVIAVLVWGVLAGVISSVPYILLYIAAIETATSGYYFARDYAMDPPIQILVVIWACQVFAYATMVRGFEGQMSVVRFLLLFAVIPISLALAVPLFATGVISALTPRWHPMVGPWIGYGLYGLFLGVILGRKEAGLSCLLISPLLYTGALILEDAIGITGLLAQLPLTMISYPFSSVANQRMLSSSAGQIAVNMLYFVGFCFFLFFSRSWWRRRRQEKKSPAVNSLPKDGAKTNACG